MTLYKQIYNPNGRSNLIILHGLFGSHQNWASISKHFAKHVKVIAFDLRNHGQSFHHENHTYTDLAQDIYEELNQLKIKETYLLGHSMGGKVGIQLAQNYPDLIKKLIVVDIAPVTYTPHHQAIFRGLKKVDITKIKTRSEADQILSSEIESPILRSFLLKNLGIQNQKFYWKININSLFKNYQAILDAPIIKKAINTPTLFIRGDQSDYINQEGIDKIQSIFKSVEIKTLKGAGHWVHAEVPEIFKTVVEEFLT